MQSGSTLTPFSYTDDIAKAREEAFRVGENLGCTPTSSQLLITCLRTKSESQILASALSFLFLSAPVIDGLFLPDHPETLVAQGRFKRTNILIGTNHDEGTAWAIPAFPNSLNSDEKPHMDRDLYDRWHGRFTYGLTNDFILAAMNNQYLDWKMVDDPDANYLDSFVAEITDQTFVAPADTLARAYASQSAGNVYLYHMTHVPTVSVYKVTALTIGPGWLGVTHGEDFQFVFGWSFIDDLDLERRESTNDEKIFAVGVMKYWLNFAKTGDPNYIDAPTTWPTFTLPGMEYMRLEPGFPTGRALRADTCNFWTHYIPQLVTASNVASATGNKAASRDHTSSWTSLSWTVEHVRRSHPQQYWDGRWR